jgi:hypothetical protein
MWKNARHLCILIVNIIQAKSEFKAYPVSVHIIRLILVINYIHSYMLLFSRMTIMTIVIKADDTPIVKEKYRFIYSITRRQIVTEIKIHKCRACLAQTRYLLCVCVLKRLSLYNGEEISEKHVTVNRKW